MTARTTEIADLEGGRVTLTAAQLDGLAARVAGPLLRPGDGDWGEAVRTWNGAAATAPALVLQPISARDVAAAVGFARDHGLLLGVKGGGHNVAGTAIAERGLTLDMARLRGVAVDPAAGLAHAAAGCLLRVVDRSTLAHGLATVLGMYSDTGVAGLTLGGGFDYLTRRFGWAVDNLAAVELVIADGAVRTANRDEHADLFWALRGGGNLGVVTRFTFRLHAVGPTVTGGLIAWGADRADAVLAAYRDLTEAAPRALTAAVFVCLAPPAPFLPEAWHGRPISGLLVCHSGARAATDLAAVRALGDLLADLIADLPYAEVQAIFDGDLPNGMSYYLKSDDLPGLASAFLDAVRDGALAVPSPPSEAMIVHIGGALNDRSADDGAGGNRAARYVVWFDAGWPPELGLLIIVSSLVGRATRGVKRPTSQQRAREIGDTDPCAAQRPVEGAQMATFVIVHGAFGGGWEWREVAALLRARGHAVFTPTLTGFGERAHLASPTTDLETHIQDILNVLRYEDLHEVVLACQSYGGMVATGVADRAPDRLVHLVYLNALVPQNGQSAFDLAPPDFRRRFEEAALAEGGGWRIPVPPFEDDPRIAAFARGRYVPSPLRGFTDPIRLGRAPGRLARTYIWCTEDQAGLAGVAALMRPFAERARREPGWRFRQLAAIPDAYIVAPQAVADLFDEAARAG